MRNDINLLIVELPRNVIASHTYHYLRMESKGVTENSCSYGFKSDYKNLIGGFRLLNF